jgi:hypothetical protein
MEERGEEEEGAAQGRTRLGCTGKDKVGLHGRGRGRTGRGSRRRPPLPPGMGKGELRGGEIAGGGAPPPGKVRGE